MDKKLVFNVLVVLAALVVVYFVATFLLNPWVLIAIGILGAIVGKFDKIPSVVATVTLAMSLSALFAGMLLNGFIHGTLIAFAWLVLGWFIGIIGCVIAHYIARD